MNDEILELAKECEVWQDFGGGFESIEAFYRAAYNKGVLRSAIAARNFWSNQHDQSEESAYEEIRSLEMK